MNIERLKYLAGLNEGVQVDEVVELDPNWDLDEIIKRLDACKRALSIANKLQDPADRKKYVSATFANMNKIRGAMQRLIKEMK